MNNDSCDLVCPHEECETFALPIDDVEMDVETNMRDPDGPELRVLAESMRPSSGIGQLQPILVAWTGDHYKVIAGFRRLLAMRRYRDEMHFSTILAWRVPARVGDLVRLAENAARKNPSSFETARYVFEMATATKGRRGFHSADIGAVIGKSGSYVRHLVRIFRGLPPDVRRAWDLDRDGRFTFERLNELVRIAHTGDDDGVQAKLATILGVSQAKQTSSFVVPLPDPAEEAEPRRVRGLTRKRAAKLAARLDIGDRLQDDDRGELVRTILRSVAGLESWKATEKVVDDILSYIGGPDRPGPPPGSAAK